MLTFKNQEVLPCDILTQVCETVLWSVGGGNDMMLNLMDAIQRFSRKFLNHIQNF